MALPVIFDSRLLKVKVGNGASPEVFAHPCLINNERSLTVSSDVSEETVYDCADDDAPGVVVRVIRSNSLTITGGGRAHKDDLDTYMAWKLDGTAKNVQVEAAGSGGVRVEAQVLLSEFSISGSAGEYANVNLTMVSTGEITSETIS